MRWGHLSATASIAFALLSLASVGLVATLSLTSWLPLPWLGPASSLGGLFSWAAGVALGGVALGTGHSRRAVIGLSLCAFAALCFAVMVLALAALP